MTESTAAGPTAEEFSARCLADPELGLAVRFWSGGVRFNLGSGTAGSTVVGFTAAEGRLTDEIPQRGPGVIEIDGPAAAWAPMFETVPPRFFNDIAPALNAGLTMTGDPLTWWQYLPAVQRAIELLRQPAEVDDDHNHDDDRDHNRDHGHDRNQDTGSTEAPRPPAHQDSPIGRYVHLQLQGHDHRLYYEEAGPTDGIPLLLQHTAGSHGVQWRHLFEESAITDRFRLIAYDLPFHGKSIPPVGKRWWEEQYRLDGSFLRSIPVSLAAALELDRPCFMGCSVGGLLALDLAHKHPDTFSEVISLEGALRIGGDWDSLVGFWNPKVSNETKARMMEGLCAPNSPDAYRKEVVQTYSAGWPPAFKGDLWYYMVDYDLREQAAEIDTDRVGVHILNGEYDYTGSIEKGRSAAEAIAGAVHIEMPSLGHFPMAEHPVAFMNHLLPVLDTIAARRP